MFTKIPIYSFLVIASLLAITGSANSLTYTASSGSLSASATFVLSSGTLTVTLKNTSTADVLVPTDVLTGVFFSTSHTLTPLSASLNGSSVFYDSLVNNVGEGWSYKSGVSAQGKNSGISAAGLGVFSSPNFYNPAVTPLNGLNYGILSAGDNAGTGNGGITGHGPLIKNSVQFNLTAASDFSLSEIGNTVVFQYGTSLSEPHFNGSCVDCSSRELQTLVPTPEPGTLLLVGSLLSGLGFFGRKRIIAVVKH